MDKWNEISTGGWEISWRVIIGYCKNKKKKQLLWDNFSSTEFSTSSFTPARHDVEQVREERERGICSSFVNLGSHAHVTIPEPWPCEVARNEKRIGSCELKSVTAFFFFEKEIENLLFVPAFRYLNLLCFLIRLFNLKHFVFVLLLTIILRKKRNLKVILNSCMQLFLIN